MRAVSVLEATVQNDADDLQIPSVRRLVQSCGFYRVEAMAVYEGHLLTHSVPVWSAAASELAYC
jgi:hypothetical protein